MSVGRGRGMTLPAWMSKDPAAAAALGNMGSAPGGLSNGSSGFGAPPPQPPPYQQQPQQQQQYQPPPPIPGQFSDAAPQHHHQQQQQQPPPPQQQQHPSGGGGYGGPSPAALEYMRRSPERTARPPGVRGRVHSSHTGPQAVAAGNYSQSSRKNRHSRSTSADRDRRDIRRKRRKERGTNFDVLPEGMDEATANQIAAQAFLQQTMPSVAAAASAAAGAAAGGIGIPVLGGAGIAAQSNPVTGLLAPASIAPSMQQTRHARRLYVGNIPRISEEEVQKFFEDVLDRALGYRIEGGPVVSVYLNTDRGFAFVELKSVALTTAAMQLDGISMGDIQLKIRRPSDYNAAAVPPEANTETVSLNLAALGIISTTVPDGPNKVFIGGLPYHLTEEQVKELLSAFGPLKSLHLVKEAGASNSKGYGFCEYMNPEATAIACQGLNGMALGDKTLTVRSAQSAAEQQIAPLPNNGASMSTMVPVQHIQLPSGMSMQSIGGVAPSEAEQLMLAQAMAGLDPNANANSAAAAAAAAAAASSVRAMAPTRVLVLLNMVLEEELLDDQDYSDVSRYCFNPTITILHLEHIMMLLVNCMLRQTCFTGSYLPKTQSARKQHVYTHPFKQLKLSHNCFFLSE
jgi:splicing factor U2AF 65 kDa subunit